MTDELRIIQKFLDRKNVSPDELWVFLLELNFSIAGPWVPSGDRRSVSRYSIHGQKVAQAFSQDELVKEDERLCNWGWLTTDKNRNIPAWWFNMPAPEQANDEYAFAHE